MAITRLWQAGAEADTTNSHNVEMDTISFGFTTSATQANSGTYSFRFYDEWDYGEKGFTGTKQIRIGFWWYQQDVRLADPSLIEFYTAGGILMKLYGVDGAFPAAMRILVNGSVRDTDYSFIADDTWCHIGIDIKVDAVAGWMNVYKDGLQILSWSGNTGNADLVKFRFGNFEAFHEWRQYCYVDDIYLDDTTGEAAAPVPDLRFEPITPNGQGNHNDWDGSDGNQVNNYELLDERPNDGDTTYIEAQVLNERDTSDMTTYTMDAGWSIQAIIPFAMAKKTDAGTDTEIAMATRSGGVDDTGSDQDLPASYGLMWDRFTTDPGGGAWSQAELDALEVGVVGRGTF